MLAQPFINTNNLLRFVLVALILIWGCLLAGTNFELAKVNESKGTADLPYGVFTLPNGKIATQDLAYNLLFLRGVQERRVDHPYRLADQETLMHQMLPQAKQGMTHAYSPVTFVLALPSSRLTGRETYFIYTLLCALGTVALYVCCLAPRMETRLQVYAFLVCTVSVCVISQLETGQSALITTALLGFLWHLLRRRPGARPLATDFAIALLFWALCSKASVAVIPAAMLVSERAWRPLLITFLLLGVTWLSVARFYGGTYVGLADYVHLLNHYDNAEFPPYFQRNHTTISEARASIFFFSLKRVATLAATLALIGLRWKGLITASQLFRGMVWVFLLFSPYLLASEDWILCLLIVEGGFFRSTAPGPVAAKLVLLAALFNLRAGITFAWPTEVELKWVLFTWMVFEESRFPAGAVLRALHSARLSRS